MVTAQMGRRAFMGHGILTLKADENIKLRVHNIRGASQEIRYDIVMIWHTVILFVAAGEIMQSTLRVELLVVHTSCRCPASGIADQLPQGANGEVMLPVTPSSSGKNRQTMLQYVPYIVLIVPLLAP